MKIGVTAVLLALGLAVSAGFCDIPASLAEEISPVISAPKPSYPRSQIPVVAVAEIAELSQTAQAIANRLAENTIRIETQRLNLKNLRDFYARRLYVPVWHGDAQAAARRKVVLTLMAEANQDGLQVADYQLGMIENLAGVDQELAMTDMVMRYMRHLATGRVRPGRVDREIFLEPPRLDVVQSLTLILAEPDPVPGLRALAPHHPLYTRLKQALAMLDARMSAEPRAEIPTGDSMKPGMEDARTPLLCQRLKLENELAADCTSLVYGEPLVSVLKNWQERHGLEADGIVGRKTLNSLNQPDSFWREKIVLAMERLRWLPDAPNERHVLVNMAGYNLRVIEQDVETLVMKVIVGRAYFHTPEFSSIITSLTVNPSWHVPARILSESVLEKEHKKPGYLASHGYVAQASDGSIVDVTAIDWNQYAVGSKLPWKLRQKPGDINALGRIKFNLDNPFAVYLHDTPDKELFNKTIRNFSSGCIRLEDAEKLARHLLSQTAQTPLTEMLASGKTRNLGLDMPIPVYLIYLTAWVEADGSLYFADDSYGRDAKLAKAIGL